MTDERKMAEILAILDRDDTPDDPAPTEQSTWAPVDLTDALNNTDIPAPDILTRTDGVNLIYSGRTHWFQGEPEACKTWLAGATVAAILNDNQRVIWIDFEDDERTAVARLRALGVDAKIINDSFTYIRPEEPLIDKHGKITRGHIDLERVLADGEYALIVIDGVTEAMVTESLNLLDNADIALWLRILPKRLAKMGPAVICLDHVTKDREGQGRWAIGGQHKLAGITGAAYAFEVVKPFARAMGAEPHIGTVFVKVVKDRSGFIRAHASDGRVAVMELTSYADGTVEIQLLTPESAPAPDLALCRKIASHLATYDGESGRQIHTALGGNESAIRAALKWMADDERLWITIEKKGRSHLHSLTRKGREDLV